MPWLIYIDEKDVYIRMSEVEQDLIDKGKEQGAYALEYVFPMEDKHGNTRFTPYMLDLEQNVQINKQSNKNRPFVFFSGSSLANCPLLSPRAPMQWLIYIDEKDVYIRMSKVEQDVIEKGKAAGFHEIQYVWHMEDKHGKPWFTTYVLDLEQSVQINERTGKRRPFGFFSGNSLANSPIPWLIYIDEKDVYIRMSKVEQDFIEKGKEEGYQLIQYVWKTEDKHGKTWFTQYELDLEHSMQINKRTGKKRSFAFFGGSS